MVFGLMLRPLFISSNPQQPFSPLQQDLFVVDIELALKVPVVRLSDPARRLFPILGPGPGGVERKGRVHGDFKILHD